MTRLLSPAEARSSADAPSLSDPATTAAGPSGVCVRTLQLELEELRREVAALQVQRRRDLATARGLGEALQAVRRGAMALREENEELRREARRR
jgi:hypothetical protein